MWFFGILAIAVQLVSAGNVASSRFSYMPDGKVVATFDKNAIARCQFTTSINQTGWNNLHIITSSKNHEVSDEKQAYAAGYLEGYATYEYILAHLNTQRKIFYMEQEESGIDWKTDKKDFPNEIYDYIMEQWKWMEEQVKNAGEADKEMWNRVHLIMKTIEGIADGVKAAGGEKTSFIELKHLVYLNNFADIESLIGVPVIKPRDMVEDRPLLSMDRQLHCSALVRAVDKNGEAPKSIKDVADVYFSHNTWTSFFQMNRLLKQITIDFSDPSAAKTVLMSSFPGITFSMDDFYITSNQLAIFETTYGIFSDIRKQVVKEAIPTCIRSTMAVRFSMNVNDFNKLLGFHNSGTYNNGFTILDRKALAEQVPEGTELLGEVEQIPGHVKLVSSSERLLNDGWFPSLNAPNDDEMYELAGYNEITKDGDLYYAREGSRFQIYKREMPNTKTFEDFQKLMRYGDFSADDLAGLPGEHDPGSVILSRYDMRNKVIDVDGTKKIGGMVYNKFHGRALMGGIDAKCFKLTDMENLDFAKLGTPGLKFHAISSPSHNFTVDGKPAPAFNFKDLGLDLKDGVAVPNPKKYDEVLEGSLMPMEWDFDWVLFTSLGESSFLPDKIKGFLPLTISCVVIGGAAAVAALVVEIIFARSRKISSVQPLLGDEA